MYQRTILDNGLRIVTSTMPHTRSVAVHFYSGVGSRYETEAQAGISHFIEHLRFRGTAKWPTSKDISSAIEGVGGMLNGATDKELTLFWVRVAQPHFSLALDVLVDMMLYSKFDPQDTERERQIIIEEINMSKDSPSQRVDMLIDELLWPGHPLGRDIAGSRESMLAITQDMILDYVNSQYLPGNTVIAITGNIQHQEAVDAVSRALGKWTNRRSPPQYSVYQEQKNPRLQIETKDTEQVHLCLALPGLPLLHPKRFALGLLNVILGEGMSSRLFTEIRDKLGIVYSIHSYVDHFLDTGSVAVSAGVDAKNLQVVIEAITEQLVRLKEPIPEAEVSKAKEMAKGRLLLRMEDTRSVAGWLGGQEVLTGEILSVDQIVAIIDAITPDELQEIAHKLLVGSQLRLAVVGPVSSDESLEPLLKI